MGEQPDTVGGQHWNSYPYDPHFNAGDSTYESPAPFFYRFSSAYSPSGKYLLKFYDGPFCAQVIDPNIYNPILEFNSLVTPDQSGNYDIPTYPSSLYSWRVRAVSDYVIKHFDGTVSPDTVQNRFPWSDCASFYTKPEPQSPVFGTPSIGYFTLPGTCEFIPYYDSLTFQWSVVAGASQYQLVVEQADWNGNSTGTVYLNRTLDAADVFAENIGVCWPGDDWNSFDIENAPPGVYVWRVRAGNGVEWGDWVTGYPCYFKTIGQPPF